MTWQVQTPSTARTFWIVLINKVELIKDVQVTGKFGEGADKLQIDKYNLLKVGITEYNYFAFKKALFREIKEPNCNDIQAVLD